MRIGFHWYSLCFESTLLGYHAVGMNPSCALNLTSWNFPSTCLFREQQSPDCSLPFAFRNHVPSVEGVRYAIVPI